MSDAASDKIEWLASEDERSHYGFGAFFLFQRKVTHPAPAYGEELWHIARIYGDGRVTLFDGEHITKEDLAKLIEWLSSRYLQPLRRI